MVIETVFFSVSQDIKWSQWSPGGIKLLKLKIYFYFIAGTQIKPWKITDLLASVRLFIQNPIQRRGNPRDSIADTHLLMKDNTLFAVAVRIDINKYFHNPDSPKFPLTVTSEVTHVGRSSFRQSYIVKHPETSTPYITGECDEVLISKVSRRPAEFPDWWVEKYAKLVKPKEKRVKPPVTQGAIMNKYNMKVEFEHLDYNSHTTTSDYIKFAINAAFQSVRKEKRGSISLEHMRAGLKSMQMFFHEESSFGDTLNVTTYDNSSRGNEMLVEISKRSSDKEESDEMCCTVVLEFFEPKNP